jgi:hypothetical protein
MKPFQIKEEGFKHVDRVINIVSDASEFLIFAIATNTLIDSVCQVQHIHYP